MAKRPQPPQPPQHGEDADRLTEDDEKILDKIMAEVTPEEMAARRARTMRLWADKFPQHKQEKGE